MSKPPLPLPNQQPSTLTIDIGQFLQEKQFEQDSPYNVFLNGQKSLIVMANKDSESVANIQLLTLGLSSLIEHYFRSIISKSIFLCRHSKDVALRNAQISLAAANYYKDVNLGRAIFDDVNFSDIKIIYAQTSEYLNIKLKDAGDDVKTALLDLQKIFVLRHAVVHANGFLSPRNLMELHSDNNLITAVSTTYESFENMVAVALNSIQSYNSFVFSCLLKRAFQRKYIKFDNSESDVSEFAKYWILFLGADTPESNITSSASYEKAKQHYTSS